MVIGYLLWAGPLEDVKMNQCKTQLQKNPLPKRGKYMDRETIKIRWKINQVIGVTQTKCCGN